MILASRFQAQHFAAKEAEGQQIIQGGILLRSAKDAESLAPFTGLLCWSLGFREIFECRRAGQLHTISPESRRSGSRPRRMVKGAATGRCARLGPVEGGGEQGCYVNTAHEIAGRGVQSQRGSPVASARGTFS